jgi:hypothetical protein
VHINETPEAVITIYYQPSCLSHLHTPTFVPNIWDIIPTFTVLDVTKLEFGIPYIFHVNLERVLEPSPKTRIFGPKGQLPSPKAVNWIQAKPALAQKPA